MHELICIPLGGYGTKDVESFPSYLSRLSDANSMSFRELLTFLSKTNNWQKTMEALNVNTWLEKNTYSQSIFRKFEISDNSLVSTSTFESLKVAGFRCRNNTFSFFRWCPVCISQMHNDGLFYYKLSWSMRYITFCETHHVRLQSFCASCGSRQRLRDSHNRAMEGTCSFCLKPLNVKTDLPELSFNEVGEFDLIRLISDISSGAGRAFSKKKLQKSVRYLYETYYRNTNIETDECSEYGKLLYVALKMEHISFPVLRKIGMNFSTPLSTLLEGDVQRITQPFLFETQRSEYLINNLSLNTKQELNHTFNNIQPLNVIRDICAQLNVKESYIRDNLPSFYSATTKNYNYLMDQNLKQYHQFIANLVAKFIRASPSKSLSEIKGEVHLHTRVFTELDRVFVEYLLSIIKKESNKSLKQF